LPHATGSNSEEAERWYAHGGEVPEPGTDRDLYNYAEGIKEQRYVCQEAEDWMDRYLQIMQTMPVRVKRSNISGFARKFSAGSWIDSASTR
jgi:hypothetical protein